MNLTETAQLLTVASTLDGIRRDADTVRAWQLILTDVAYPEAVDALRAHFADPDHGTEFLKPAHITRQIAAAAPSVQLPPRVGAGWCPVHAGYPITTTDGRCDQCVRHPEDLQPGADPIQYVHFVTAALTPGRTAS
jgi:hypothetical protein